MRFVKKINSIGKSEIYLDLEDLKLDLNFDYQPFLTFQVDTFSILKASSTDADWNTVFGIPHKFFDTLTEDELKQFAKFYIAAHYDITRTLEGLNEIEGDKILGLEERLSKMLAELDANTNMFPRVVSFVEQNIPIQSFASVGERAQDSAAMTFYKDDYIAVIAIIGVCKILTPIFGIFIESCKKKMDNWYKEMHCFAIMKDIINNRWERINDKLTNYILNIIKPFLSKMKYTHIFNGFTMMMIATNITAGMYVRRFICVEVIKRDGNVMKYITSCSRAAVQTQFSSCGGYKTAVTEFYEVSDDSGSDEGNTSTLEEESRTSSKTSDQIYFIKYMAHLLFRQFIIEHDLNEEIINNAIAYYEYSHPVPTQLNMYLLSVICGTRLAGAKSIELLDMPMIIKLLAMLQVFLYQQGYHDLMHMLTAVPTGQIKMTTSGSESMLQVSWSNSYEYKNCADRFPFQINNLKWDTKLHDIVIDVTTNVYKYNTAPAIWDMTQTESHNGEVVVIQDTLARSICSIIATNTL